MDLRSDLADGARSPPTRFDQAEGIFNPTGSTRLRADAASGAVDRALNFHGVENVQLLAT